MLLTRQKFAVLLDNATYPLVITSLAVVTISLVCIFMPAEQPKRVVSNSMVAVTNPPPAESTPPPISKPKSKQELAQEHWHRIAPVFGKFAKKRCQALASNTKKLEERISPLITKSGREIFIDEALGLSSAKLLLQDSQKHQQWLKRLFNAHVLPIVEFRANVTEQCQALELTLGEIDDELLLAVEMDVELDTSTIRALSLNPTVITKNLSQN